MQMQINLVEVYNGSFYNFWDKIASSLDSVDTVEQGDISFEATLRSKEAIEQFLEEFLGIDGLNASVDEIVVMG